MRVISVVHYQLPFFNDCRLNYKLFFEGEPTTTSQVPTTSLTTTPSTTTITTQRTTSPTTPQGPGTVTPRSYERSPLSTEPRLFPHKVSI